MWIQVLEDEKGEQALSKTLLGVNGSASGQVIVCVCVCVCVGCPREGVGHMTVQRSVERVEGGTKTVP